MSNEIIKNIEKKNSFLVCGIRFDIDEIYELIKPIGHGSYGIVCSAKHIKTNEYVAIKKIQKAFINLSETKRNLRELILLKKFNHHSNILSLRDIIQPEANLNKFNDLYLVTDLLSSDLHQIITSKQALSIEHIQYFIYQILRGLKYIHSVM